MRVSRIGGLFAVLLVLVFSPKALSQSLCSGDATNDGQVNSVDIAQILADWGSCASCPGDIDADGQVNASDLALVLAGWGPCRPVILSISPNSGHVSGGTLVTITGAYLGSASIVEFGGVSGTSLQVVNSSTLRVVTPANSPGGASVRVTTNAGSGLLKGGYEYLSVLIPGWAALIEAEPDPNVVFDAALRKAIADTGYAWRVRHTQTLIEMLLIPPGSFQMGCTGSFFFGCYSDENPTFPVTLTQPFYLGRFEVTQSQWQAVVGSNPSFYQGACCPDFATRPVERVSWNMIQDFTSATGLRLPTEAEWEYACRAGTTTGFHGCSAFPNGILHDWNLNYIAWHDQNASQTKPVGLLAGNAFGLHDMSGNVAEWVNDFYGAYPLSPTDPAGPPSGLGRVFRGGATSSSYECRSSNRSWEPPGSNYHGFGFRVARNP